MLEFLSEFLARSAVMVPTMIVCSAAVWLILTRVGWIKPAERWNAFDMRTWPLRFVVGDAVTFALVYAGITALTNDGEIGVPLGAALAGAVAMGLVPRLLAQSRGSLRRSAQHRDETRIQLSGDTRRCDD